MSSDAVENSAISLSAASSVIVVFNDVDSSSIGYQILNTFVLYFWFILSTKTDIRFTIVLLISLFLIYIVKAQIDYYKTKKDQQYKNTIRNLEYFYNFFHSKIGLFSLLL